MIYVNTMWFETLSQACECLDMHVVYQNCLHPLVCNKMLKTSHTQIINQKMKEIKKYKTEVIYKIYNLNKRRQIKQKNREGKRNEKEKKS